MAKTIAQLTAEYNEYATKLDLPLIKKLKTTKQGTPAERVEALRKQLEEQTAAKKVVLEPGTHEATINSVTQTKDKIITKATTKEGLVIETSIPTQCYIIPIRQNTQIRVLAELLLEGGTVAELTKKMNNWTPNSIRAGINWDLKKKGYIIEKVGIKDGNSIYQITNATTII